VTYFLLSDQGSFIFTSRSVHATQNLCVERLQFVPPWLICRHTHRQHLHHIIWKAQPAKWSEKT